MGAARARRASRGAARRLTRVIHLDTSFLIRGLVRGSSEDRLLRRWLRAGNPVRLSAMAWAEFLCGPVSPTAMAEAAELFGEPISFDAIHATLAARMFNQSGRRRGTLADCMIAAVAMRTDATLATSNAVDFRRLEPLGLVIVTT